MKFLVARKLNMSQIFGSAGQVVPVTIVRVTPGHDDYDINKLSAGEKVTIVGISKGRGFAGVVKRHHFHGSPKTHGHKHDLRSPGSIGATDAARVFPGRRMAGRMGGEQVTIKNVVVESVDPAQGLIILRGGLPGARNGLIRVYG